MQDEDPTGENIASVLSQAGLDTEYSGAAILSESPNETSDEGTIERTAGFGDEFMVGRKRSAGLSAYQSPSTAAGPVPAASP